MILYLIISLLFGLAIGSFLNVVIWRVPNGKSLLPDSRCPNCDHKITALENIPVLSWLFLKGKCSDCKNNISMRYPIIELMTGVLFMLTTWMFLPETISDWPIFIALLYLMSISVALTMIDLDVKRLPNKIVYPSYVVIISLFSMSALLNNDFVNLMWAFIGLFMMLTVYFIMFVVKPGGMGFGDVKLAGLLGFVLMWFSWQSFVIGFFSAYFFAGFYILVATLFMKKKMTRKTQVPFGPWMFLGTWTGIYFGETIINWYLTLLA